MRTTIRSINDIHVLITHSCNLNFAIKRFDIETTYLHSHLEEDVLVELLAGATAVVNRVCKLQRSIYDLKQSGAV